MIPALWTLTDYAVNTMAQKNIDVIWSNQNAARIDKPYVSLNYTSDDVPNFEWHDTEITSSGYRKMYSWRRATVDMQFYYGNDSLKLADFVAMAFNSDIMLNEQQRLNVSIGNRLFLQRVPAMLNNSQWEERAIYQFDFYYTQEMDEYVGLIETVVIEGTYTGAKTVVTCQEIVSIVPQTFWDEDDTTWDDYTTTWDGAPIIAEPKQ